MIDIKSFFIGFITCIILGIVLYCYTDLFKEGVVLNNEELDRIANEKAKIIIDSVRALPMEQRIDWIMSDN